MKIRFPALLSMVAAGAIVVGCAQKRTQPAAQSASPQKVVQLPPTPEDPPTDPAEKVKQPRFGESVVYIDGKPVGVMRASELPTSLKARVVNIGGGYQAIHYGFLAYVRALGIDSKRIKGLHIYGGSRVSLLDKAEVARIGEKVDFTFTQGERGKPRVEWPSEKLFVNTTIDMISSVSIYIDKEPPHLDADRNLLMPDGSRIDGKVPYAPEEQGNGTRVYVDGQLVGTVKRKKITNDMLAPVNHDLDTLAGKTAPESKTAPEAKTEDRFSLLSYAAKLRPDARQVRSIDLVAGDDVVAHLPGDAARSLLFHVPQHNRGQAVVQVPSSEGTEAARISAVQIYINSTAPSRPIVKIADARDAGLGQGQGQGQGQGGSSSDEER